MTQPTTKASPIKDLSFEDALGQLESIVKQLENGQIKLDDAMEHYTKGAALKDHCEKKLAQAKLKVEKITTPSD